MEYIDFQISSENINIPIERKRMKNVRLRVYPNGEIKVSAPLGVSYEWIDKYIKDKEDWINKKLSDFKQTKGIEAVDRISNGTSIKLFGKDYYAKLKQSQEKRIYIDENALIIKTSGIANQEALSSQLELWLKSQLRKQIDTCLVKLYPIIKKHGFIKPDINIRKMKTMWGSCNAPRNNITFNYYLYQAHPRLIEYVMLHELIHFVQRNHNKQFYALLSLYMPDWKERKHYLDHEVMQSVNLIL